MTDVKEGMGGTVSVGSDSYPVTVVTVFPGGRGVLVQDDNAVRVDKNGISESQEYEYSENLQGCIDHFTLRRNGRWIRKGSSMRQGTPLHIGHRRMYRDPSF